METKELVIKSLPDNVLLVEQFIESLRDQYDFKDDSFGNIMIATTEAVNNCIIHGNKKDSSKDVIIRCELLKTYMIRISVIDEGDGFDPTSLGDPTAPENVQNIGGRGVFIMEHLSDSIKYENNGSVVLMDFSV